MGGWGPGGDQATNQCMQQRMFQQMGNHSQAPAPHLMHQYANNYTHLYEHEYLWNYCNSTGTGQEKQKGMPRLPLPWISG